MRRIVRAVLVGAVLLLPLSLSAPASAGPCPPEGYCPPCPIVITFEGKKPHIESAQC